MVDWMGMGYGGLYGLDGSVLQWVGWEWIMVDWMGEDYGRLDGSELLWVGWEWIMVG